MSEPKKKATRQRKGWERIRGGVNGLWRHVASGWLVKRAPHPTCLWPYYGKRPGTGEATSELLLVGGWGLGHAFQTLKHAQEAVERELEREALERMKGGG